MLTREEIKKKLQEDPEWTLPDDASDEDWDLYFEVKDEMEGIDTDDDEDDDDSWEDDEEDF
jgi:hypothetical protein